MIEVPFCSEEEWREAYDLTQKYAPTQTLGWRRLYFPPDHFLGGAAVYDRLGDKLNVILSAARWVNDPVRDRVWLHVSMAFKNKLPSYQDMCDCKRIFVGPERQAMEIFAKESRHVNIHKNARHLWSCVEGTDLLPDFGRFGSI